MKYKRKDTKINFRRKDRLCVDLSDYNYFNTRLAHTEALAQLQRAYGNHQQSFATACTWSVGFEVKNARFEIGAGNALFGLSPKPRCEPADNNRFDILGAVCNTGNQTEKKEYIPGGARPPCPGGAEGVCALTNTQEKPSQGSSWQNNNSIPPQAFRTALSYDWRFVPKSIIWKPSGRSCGTPMPQSWTNKQGGGASTGGIRGDVKAITQSRCFDEVKDYDCCCSCPPDQVKIPQIVPGLAPCYNLSLNQQQLDQLRTAIQAALVAGACVLAAVLAAKFTAIAIAAYATAGCAYQMIAITAPCQNTTP